MFQNARQFAVSVAMHTLLLGFLWTFTVDQSSKATVVQVTSTLPEFREPEDFLDMVQDFDAPVNRDAPVGFSSGPAVNATDALRSMDKEQLGAQAPGQASEQPAVRFTRDARLIRPIANRSVGLKLDTNIDGVGTQVMASGGDSGSVDRITVEILRQLDKSKVLVAWVMDSSGSMQARREEVIQRFERIYHELGVLKADSDAALLTAVVAFGEKTVIMTPKPVSDHASVLAAVRDIKPDASGKENIFSAVKETVTTWRKFQTHGRRKLMVVVLTDEIGNDQSLLDDTVDLVKRTKAGVYILGPMAPFGRKEVNVRWVDEPTGEVFQIPIERGPETVQPEHLRLPYWFNGPQFDLFPSGFGPFALTRLARESGGIYFMYDDDSIPGPKFNLYDLLEYSPNYNSHAEYMKEMSQHPMRAAVIKSAQQSDGAGGTPEMQFLAGGEMAQTLGEAQRSVAKTIVFVERALADLRQVEKLRDKETAKRWQAHFDLVMGRLLAARVRCNEYNWALAQMRTTPQIPKGEGKNAWLLTGDEKIKFGVKSGPGADQKRSTNVGKSDPRETQQAREDAEKALFYLKRVQKEHEGTPWGMMAARELEAPLAFKWQESYIEPQPQPGEQPTPKQAAAQQQMTRRAEAMKRIPKL